MKKIKLKKIKKLCKNKGWKININFNDKKKYINGIIIKHPAKGGYVKIISETKKLLGFDRSAKNIEYAFKKAFKQALKNN